MSKERESKRRSPSIIARLMGIEGLPIQQPVRKQQKRSASLEHYQQRTASVGLGMKDTHYEGRSFRKSSKEEQEFKDVFEVLESTKVDSSSYPVRRSQNSQLTEPEMAFIRQKFMDAKRLSTDEKLQGSKEFHDALEVLDSNKDLLLKFLQGPDPLFSKHIHDLQGSPTQTHCSHVAIRKTSEARKSGSNVAGFLSDRETILRNRTSSSQKHCDGSLSLPYSRGAHNAHKSSRIQLENMDDTSRVPTRIVVLKPNLGSVQNVSNSVPSPHYSHAFRSDNRMPTEFPNVKSRSADLQSRKNFSDDLGLSRHKSKESREIAKKITRRMRSNMSTGSLNISSSGFIGYVGDESSCYLSGNDSATESEVTTLASRKSFDWNDRHRLSSSHSSDSSSVNREAKKRLSERWKMTHRFQEVGLAGRSSTLGEMLSIHDREVKAESLDNIIGQDGSSDRCSGLEKPAGAVCPLGISSKDGWKDGCIRNLSRSRSLPASSASFGSPKTSMRRETLGDDRDLMPKVSANLRRRRSVKGNSNRKGGSFSSTSRSTAKKAKSSCFEDWEDSDTAQEIHVCHSQASNLEENSPYEQKSTVSESSICNIMDKSLVIDAVGDVEQENMVFPSEPHGELLADPSACLLVKEDYPTRDLDNSTSKETSREPSEKGSVPLSVHESESPASSKESEQPSPISVLEASFADNLSSGSECFESLSADLQGLRMQLQLLKLESDEAYVEGPMGISSDEDVGEGSLDDSVERGMLKAEVSLESSYVVEVLIDSGFGTAEPDEFMETWRAPDWPIDLSVFEKLEKKYCDQTNWLRSERRILFDRINSGLVEVFQSLMDPHPWVKPMERRVGMKKSKKALEDELCKLLANQEKKANKDPMEKVLGKESQWLDLGDDIDVIGRELERMLIDELVIEVIGPM